MEVKLMEELFTFRDAESSPHLSETVHTMASISFVRSLLWYWLRWLTEPSFAAGGRRYCR
jgi:hypothetical protein